MKRAVDARRWVRLAGYGLYVAVLSAGYYYNLTFVQLGIIDLATRRVGLSSAGGSGVMAGFALLAFVAAVVTGGVMDRRGWSSMLRIKLKGLFYVVVGQTLLTATAGRSFDAAWLKRKGARATLARHSRMKGSRR